jgi:glycosyltransferase involved in cell wall biosynthesis
VLFASRLLREKGVFELIEACRQLRSKGLDFELLLAGTIVPGTVDSLTPQDLEKFEASGLGRLLGHVEDMPSCFDQADIVVLPSYHEGTPRVLLEAAASGLPLVATDIAGCRGVVQPGRNGELVPVGAIDALADALEKLIRSPALRATYGTQSRAIVESGFCEAQVVNKTLSVYHRLLKWPIIAKTSNPVG